MWKKVKIYIKIPAYAGLAQLVEHLIRNEGVVGSSPITGTTEFHRSKARAENRVSRRSTTNFKKIISNFKNGEGGLCFLYLFI